MMGWKWDIASGKCLLLPQNKEREKQHLGSGPSCHQFSAMCDCAKANAVAVVLERAVAFIALISQLLEDPSACVGVWAGTRCKCHRESSPPKSQLAVIYTQAHRLGNCSKQNKQTSLWIYGLAKGPLTTKEMCFPALFYHQIPTKGLNAYVKPTELRIWAGFKLFLHLLCYPNKSSHSSSPAQLPADTHTHM